MTYQKLKEKILAHLSVSEGSGAFHDGAHDEILNSVVEASNSAQRSVASVTGCIKRRAPLSFVQCGTYFSSELPDDFCEVCAVYSGGRRYVGGRFDVLGDAIIAADYMDAAELIYTAYPADITGDDGQELEYDDAIADIVALGAAMNLCPTAYPGDFNRYLAIATEYDSKLSNEAISRRRGGYGRVMNTLYGRRMI